MHTEQDERAEATAGNAEPAPKRSGRSIAGEKGGRTTAERHRNDDFYREIGRKGGKARRKR